MGSWRAVYTCIRSGDATPDSFYSLNSDRVCIENDAVRFEFQFTEFSKQANEPFRRIVATTEKIGIPLGRYVS